ncbi:MAG: hypothetical protein JRG91_10170 [Deltaproteobacteria bacterium]|nr:hypothetical protein [Deltaproteobacteria bacterium]
MKVCLIPLVLVAVVGCSTTFTTSGDAGGEADGPGGDTGGEVAPDTPAEVPPDCGNGEVDDGEECDDGNDEDMDGCTSDCTWTCESDEECSIGYCTEGICDLYYHMCETHEVDCTDDDPCTDDWCDPESGCVYEDLPDWYPDGDEDGFGGSDGAAVCAASAPTGHVDNADDCCDVYPVVNPGITAYFVEPYTCGGYGTPSYDYNCDGTEEQRYTAMGSCALDSITGTCTVTEGWLASGGVTTMPACGETSSWMAGCMLDSYGDCVPSVGTSRIQTCR